jgi:hypothetical protein
MSKPFAIFTGLFMATVALFILGVVMGSLFFISISFVATLALFVVRRFFLEPS